MTARYLLDTNICIYIARQRPPEVLGRFRKLKPGEALISVITWGELCYGAGKSEQRDKAMRVLEEFAALVPVAPVSETVGQTYGAIRAALEAKGASIGNNDLWIAAHAKDSGLILVTNNERDFKRVSGLKVQNWAARTRRVSLAASATRANAIPGSTLEARRAGSQVARKAMRVNSKAVARRDDPPGSSRTASRRSDVQSQAVK